MLGLGPGSLDGPQRGYGVDRGSSRDVLAALVLSRGLNELREEPPGPGVLAPQLLGVTLHSYQEGVVSALDGFDYAVGCPRRSHQAGGYFVDALVVRGIHAHAALPNYLPQA